MTRREVIELAILMATVMWFALLIRVYVYYFYVWLIFGSDNPFVNL